MLSLRVWERDDKQRFELCHILDLKINEKQIHLLNP